MVLAMEMGISGSDSKLCTSKVDFGRACPQFDWDLVVFSSGFWMRSPEVPAVEVVGPFLALGCLVFSPCA